jgi:type IV secretion system protein VirB10
MSMNQSGRETDGLFDSPSVVGGSKRLQLTNWQKVGVAGLVAAIFLAFIWIDYSLKAKNADKSPELAVQPNQTAFRPAPLLPAPSALQSTPPPSPAAGAHEISPAESPLFAYLGNSSASLSNSVASLGNSAASLGNTGASLLSLGRTGLAGQAAGPIVPPLAVNAVNAADASNALAAQLKPTSVVGSRATLLPHPNLLITKGTIIPCTMQTAINTELAGFVKCVLPEAVRSTTGNVVLLDRGTTMVGEVQSGVSQGKDRVFILWDRAETPQHAIITLASPGADELGRAGVSGTVDDHFWDRFGAALMFTIVDGGLQAGAAYAGSSGSSGTGTYLNTFQSQGQQVANTSLQSSINIPPTLEKNQGDSVSIFVARDIDFSSVYELKMVK